MIDLHCDTLYRLVNSPYSLQQNPFHLDIKRALEAGVVAQVFALFHYNSDYNITLRAVLEQMAIFHRQLQGTVTARAVTGIDGFKAAAQRQELACILHLEGADALGNDACLWELFHRLGVCSLGLTWNHNNAFAGGVMDRQPLGLTKAGIRLLQVMEGLGTILDLAHVAWETYYEALDRYTGAVMVSHANAKAIRDHPRNLDDRQLQALAEHGGIIGVTLVPNFVDAQSATMSRLLDHIGHICELIGVEHVALGSDFDGADELLLAGIEDYRNLPGLLHKRGFSEQEIRAILHDNASKFLQRALIARQQ